MANKERALSGPARVVLLSSPATMGRPICVVPGHGTTVSGIRNAWERISTFFAGQIRCCGTCSQFVRSNSRIVAAAVNGNYCKCGRFFSGPDILYFPAAVHAFFGHSITRLRDAESGG